jgi:hypothetical protein
MLVIEFNVVVHTAQYRATLCDHRLPALRSICPLTHGVNDHKVWPCSLHRSDTILIFHNIRAAVLLLLLLLLMVVIGHQMASHITALRSLKFAQGIIPRAAPVWQVPQ